MPSLRVTSGSPCQIVEPEIPAGLGGPCSRHGVGWCRHSTMFGLSAPLLAAERTHRDRSDSHQRR